MSSLRRTRWHTLASVSSFVRDFVRDLVHIAGGASYLARVFSGVCGDIVITLREDI